jgi:hypothetical protein
MGDSVDKDLVKVLTEAYRIGHKVHMQLLSKARAADKQDRKDSGE